MSFALQAITSNFVVRKLINYYLLIYRLNMFIIEVSIKF